MTESEKICPFMSRPMQDCNDSEVYESGNQNTVNANSLYEVVCVKERCMAWGKKDVTPVGDVIEGCRMIP